MEKEKEKRIRADKREGVQWIRGKKKKGKPKRKRGGKLDIGEKEKNVGEEEDRERKENRDFPGVPTVESRQFECDAPHLGGHFCTFF